MVVHSLSKLRMHQSSSRKKRKNIELQIAQEKIYKFLIEIVKKWPPEDVLREFKRLFIQRSNSASEIHKIFQTIDKEQDFRNTLKRCCYILVNNWESNRKNKYIQELINLLINHKSIKKTSYDINNDVLTTWLDNFIASSDFQELKLFAYRNEYKSKGHWVNRYTSYLLVAQSVNTKNSAEQQEAARKASKQLKDKFKFELAMYVARSQSISANKKDFKNPSILGDEVLRLIKAIVAKKGVFSYENIANIFLKQTQNQPFKEFKESLQKYLIFSVQQPKFVETLNQQLSEKLLVWKPEYDAEIIDKDLLLRTCNRVIDFLTTENGREPSPLFTLLLSHGHPLTLVIVLLKIILISRNSRSHLEARIAHLICYYEKEPESECKWVINLLEMFNITFAIYGDNVEYNLIKIKEDQPTCEQNFNPDAYRVFSQLKLDPTI